MPCASTRRAMRRARGRIRSIPSIHLPYAFASCHAGTCGPNVAPPRGAREFRRRCYTGKCRAPATRPVSASPRHARARISVLSSRRWCGSPPPADKQRPADVTFMRGGRAPLRARAATLAHRRQVGGFTAALRRGDGVRAAARSIAVVRLFRRQAPSRCGSITRSRSSSNAMRSVQHAMACRRPPRCLDTEGLPALSGQKQGEKADRFKRDRK